MPTRELRDLPQAELLIRLAEIKEELFNLRFQNATGQLDNYKRMGLLKRDVARIETIVKERLLGIESELHETSESKRRRWSRAPGPSEAAEEEEPEQDEKPADKASGKKSKDDQEEAAAEAEPAPGEEE